MTTANPRPLSARLNPDGVSVAGCSIIYAPRGQAGEYVSPTRVGMYWVPGASLRST